MLSIVIITMNRSNKLIEALDSCIKCDLPERTDFLVFDNASTDDTFVLVNNYIEVHKDYNIKYFRSEKNLGVGGGRAKAFSMVDSEFIYFMDDDALIKKEDQSLFFVKSLEYLQNNPSVASLSTDIDDKYLGRSRTANTCSVSISGCYCIPMYLGGSHFLRKSAFSNPLYFDIKYGLEELYPSIQAMDAGYYHVIDKTICIFHNPEINKWIDNSNTKWNIARAYCVNGYCTKVLLYPKIISPILYIAHILRVKKHLNGHTEGIVEEIRTFKRNNMDVKKVKLSTVYRMYKMFGFSIF